MSKNGSNLQEIGFTEFFRQQVTPAEFEHYAPARISSQGQDCYVLMGAKASLGDLTGNLRDGMAGLVRPVVGDWVLVEDSGARAVIQRTLQRRTLLQRRAPGTDDEVQLLAANVDVFFVVSSANSDFNERRLERYLTAIEASGADAVLILNKVDLVDDPAPLQKRLEEIGGSVPVIVTSAHSRAGIEELRTMIGRGQTSGLLGSSGVGKSSLVNALLGKERQRVQDIRQDDKGRHTTTARELLMLPGGGLLMDTPGMREFGLADDGDAPQETFADVISLVSQCKFSDCTHGAEPQCALKKAVADGVLSPDRFEAFKKLMSEMEAGPGKTKPRNAKKRRRPTSLAIRQLKKSPGKKS